MRRLCVALCLLLAAGCGLPLPDGVQEPGVVRVQQGRGGDIQVLPPGPRDSASADEIVRNFFGAQSDPADGHASAREFLAPELRSRWSDSGPVSVFADTLDIAAVDGSADTYRVTGALLGRLATDGSYRPARGNIDVHVRLRRGAHGRWLISQVPNGLLLSAADRDRSFRVRDVYFLAPGPAPSAPSTHLVPDRVFLPVGADSADAVVRRLVAGPSRGLGDSVLTAFPTGTTVRTVRTDDAGLVTVDLSRQVAMAPALAREQMSAQLVWTLRSLGGSFSQLRFLSGGAAVSVNGQNPAGSVQDRADWASYGPDGLTPQAPLFYLGGRRLRVLDPTTGPAADASGQVTVDAGAASPRGGGLALLTQLRPDHAELRTGPASGPFVLRDRGALSVPSWGSGELGVWFLDRGQLVLSTLTGSLVDVPVDGAAPGGALQAVRVSRDGARIGLIAGTGTDRRLLVGRIVARAGRPQVVGLTSVAPDVTDVQDLAWDSATSLVVLGRESGVTAPIRITIDGSSVSLVDELGLELSEPQSIAAAPGRPLVVGALLAGATALFRDNGQTFAREVGIVGGMPFYPG